MQYFWTRTKSHTRGTPHIQRLGAANKICSCWLRTSHVVLPCCRCGSVVLYCTCGCLICCVAGHVAALNMHVWCCVVHVCGCISIMLALDTPNSGLSPWRRGPSHRGRCRPPLLPGSPNSESTHCWPCCPQLSPTPRQTLESSMLPRWST